MKYPIKPPTTYEQQLEMLKKRNLVVLDESRALEILLRINYYTITGYLHNFKSNNADCYISGISFEKVCKIIEFDKRLRGIIASATETIERTLKTKFSYLFAHKYGPLGYLDASNFKNKREHSIFLDKLNKNIQHNKNLPFVKHHLKNYDGEFPIWVATDLFTMGMIHNFYKNLSTNDQKILARDYSTGVVQFESWIDIVTYVRNMAAHYMRLYNFKMQKTPVKCSFNFDFSFKPSYMIFDALYIMKFLVLDISEWNNHILSEITSLVYGYEEYISYSAIVLPVKWELLLKKM